MEFVPYGNGPSKKPVLFFGKIAAAADKNKIVLAMFFSFSEVFNLLQDDNWVENKNKG